MNKQTLTNNLNADLAGELSAIIQYLTYAAKATGPYRPQLVQFFLTEVADEQLHAQFLANKIVALGGEPVTNPRPVAVAHTNREMLEADGRTKSHRRLHPTCPRSRIIWRQGASGAVGRYGAR